MNSTCISRNDSTSSAVARSRRAESLLSRPGREGRRCGSVQVRTMTLPWIGGSLEVRKRPQGWLLLALRAQMQRLLLRAKTATTAQAETRTPHPNAETPFWATIRTLQMGLSQFGRGVHSARRMRGRPKRRVPRKERLPGGPFLICETQRASGRSRPPNQFAFGSHSMRSNASTPGPRPCRQAARRHQRCRGGTQRAPRRRKTRCHGAQARPRGASLGPLPPLVPSAPPLVRQCDATARRSRRRARSRAAEHPKMQRELC